TMRHLRSIWSAAATQSDLAACRVAVQPCRIDTAAPPNGRYFEPDETEIWPESTSDRAGSKEKTPRAVGEQQTKHVQRCSQTLCLPACCLGFLLFFVVFVASVATPCLLHQTVLSPITVV